MTVHCADCKGFICRGGTREGTPEDCPMRGEFPEFETLYPKESSLSFLTRAALVEAQGYCRWTRIRELGEFARLMNMERVGLAHCPDMAAAAGRAEEMLKGFGVTSVLPPLELSSDPAGQARYFESEGTQLNVLAGMCVAHEVLLLHATGVPTVSLVARDLRLRHNPAAALYTSRSYLKNDLFGHWPKKDRADYRGWDPEIVAAMACRADSPPNTRKPRLSEAMDLAHALGAQRVGVSFCVGFREEAKTLTSLLRTNGFEVSSVCCKTGAVPKEEAGIDDAQKVRPGRPEMICNPVAQAELLNRDEAHFVMVLGQCVGHDAATLQHLNAPAICLVAKDRVLAHNSVAGLYDI